MFRRETYDGQGNITKVEERPYTQEENDAFNAQIDEDLLQADMKIIRALAEGDTALINAHNASQAAKRATKRT